ncbi:MAG TPA: DUF308 domain-containing protein [Polyangia bacterium]|nr:DUF308 domain-containing protein [Polyangia bacterium]
MTATEAESRLSTHWAWVLFRGVVAVLFGRLAFPRPSATNLTLVLAFGAYAFGGGVTAVVTALRRVRDRTRGRESRDDLLLDGAVGVGLAAQALFWPTPLPIAIVWVVGAWAIASGAMELANAQRLRRALENEWSLALAGVASVGFGVLMLFWPLRGGVATMRGPLGAWATAFGVLTIALGVRLRSFFIHAHGGGRQMPRLYLAR